MASVQIELGIKDTGYSQALKDAKTKLQELNTQHGITSSKLGVANKNYNDAKKLLGDVILKYQSLSNEAKQTGYGQGLKEIIDQSKAIITETQKAKQAVKDLLDESNKSAGDGLSQINSKSGQAVSTLGQVLGKAAGPVGTLGGGLEQLGSVLNGTMSAGALAASAGIGAAGAAVAATVQVTEQAIQKSAEFGQAMSQLGAITGLQGKDLDALKEQIKGLADETDTSCVDVTNSMAKIGGAMPELLNDTEGLGEVFKASSTLAKAGLMEQDDAIQALTTSMGQFGLGADDANRTVDVLANASQAGSAEISDLASTLKVCGTAANSAGMNIDQVAAMSEVLGDKALKGSEAGTQLRNIFATFSAKGIESADEMMQELSAHAGDTTYMMQNFGKENMQAAEILAEGNTRYSELLTTMGQSGTATQMAEQNTNNLAGAWDKLKVKWENFLSSFNVDNADGICMKIVGEISDMVTTIEALFEHLSQSTSVQAMFRAIESTVDACVDIFRSCFNIIGDLIDVVADISDALGIAEGEFDLTAVAAQVVKELFAALEIVIYGLRKAIQYLCDRWKDLKKYITTNVSKVPMFETLKKYCDKMVGYLKKVIGWWNKLKSIVKSEREAEAKGNATPTNNNNNSKPKPKPQKDNNNNGNGGGGGKTTTANTNKNKGGGGKTTKQDPIKQAEDSYAKTIGLAEKQYKLGIIQYADFLKKKKQAEDTLVNAYLENGKNIDDKKVTDALSKSNQLNIDIIKQEGVDERDKSESSILSNVDKKLITEFESSRQELQAQEKYIDSLKEIEEEMIKQLKANGAVRDFTDGMMYDQNYDIIPEFKEFEDEFKQEINKLNRMKIDNVKDERTESDNEALRDYNDGLISAEEYTKKLIDSNDKLIQAISKLQQEGIEPIYEDDEDASNDDKKDKIEINLDDIKKQATDRNTKLGKEEKQTPIAKDINEITKQVEQSLGDKIMGVKITPEMRFDALSEQYDKLQELFNEKYKLKITGAIDVPQEDLDAIQSAMDDTARQMVKSFQKMNNASLDDVTDSLSTIKDVTEWGNGIAETFENATTPVEKFSAAIDMVTGAIQQYQSVMQMIDTVIKMFTATSIASQQVQNANTQQSVANSQQEATASSSAAIAKATESGSGQPYPMNIVAIAMGVAAVVAALATTISSFANGGIIGGASNHGDMNLARVNGGEMILNGRQQSNLFDLIDKGGTASSGGNVEFKIKGSDLYGTLKNYKSIKSKSGKNISI